MPDVTFYHPRIEASADGKRPGPYLNISSGLDEIAWGYRLNTTTYPTYGGEVVQILSCFIDDLQIQGTLPTIRSLERIYSYFAYFFQIASQGYSSNPEPGRSSFNQEPMIMTYPERGWQFKIIPTAAPGFQIGRDIVAPSWRLQCHVVDDSEDLHDIKEFTLGNALKNLGESDGFLDLEGRIGFRAANPFSAPGTIFGDSFDPDKSREQWRKTADRYNEIIEAYLDSDLDALYETASSRPNTDPLRDSQDAEAVKQGRQQADQERNGG